MGRYSEEFCRGQYSIQQEINRLAKGEGGEQWAKKIQSPKWREEVRLKLRQTPAQWCDYKAKECHCDLIFEPAGKRHDMEGVI